MDINMQERSLLKYCEKTRKSINTVKKWSSKFRWKERALIAANVQASEVVSGEKAPEVLPANDTGNAMRPQRDHGNIVRYCYATGLLYIWNGKCWQPDTSTEIKRLADT